MTIGTGELIAISIHAPLRERRELEPEFIDFVLISIHAPLRERRGDHTAAYTYGAISIHAPLRERLKEARRTWPSWHFNPRSLTGATSVKDKRSKAWEFQSTLPYGSDQWDANVDQLARISIHAPLRERLLSILKGLKPKNFNPRSLTGATSNPVWYSIYKHQFQSTLPYGSDCCSSCCNGS